MAIDHVVWRGEQADRRSAGGGWHWDRGHGRGVRPPRGACHAGRPSLRPFELRLYWEWGAVPVAHDLKEPLKPLLEALPE